MQMFFLSMVKLNLSKPIERLNRFEKWLYPSLQEIEAIILSKDAGMEHTYSYGKRIFNKFDQINEFIIPLLKQEPNTRRAIVSLWDVKKDADTTGQKLAPGFIIVHFVNIKKIQINKNQ